MWPITSINKFRAPSQYPKRRLFVRSRKVSKPRDLYLELSDGSEIWQALRQHCYRCACQISKRYDNLKYQSRGFETSRDLTKYVFSDIEMGPRFCKIIIGRGGGDLSLNLVMVDTSLRKGIPVSYGGKKEWPPILSRMCPWVFKCGIVFS